LTGRFFPRRFRKFVAGRRYFDLAVLALTAVGSGGYFWGIFADETH
jgi:hypothetical protein